MNKLDRPWLSNLSMVEKKVDKKSGFANLDDKEADVGVRRKK